MSAKVSPSCSPLRTRRRTFSRDTALARTALCASRWHLRHFASAVQPLGLYGLLLDEQPPVCVR